jgi:hypothetical protein
LPGWKKLAPGCGYFGQLVLPLGQSSTGDCDGLPWFTKQAKFFRFSAGCSDGPRRSAPPTRAALSWQAALPQATRPCCCWLFRLIWPKRIGWIS